MTYEEFKTEYQWLFKAMIQYTSDQVGAGYYAEKMAKLSEDYPEFEERLENELGV